METKKTRDQFASDVSKNLETMGDEQAERLVLAALLREILKHPQSIPLSVFRALCPDEEIKESDRERVYGIVAEILARLEADSSPDIVAQP